MSTSPSAVLLVTALCNTVLLLLIPAVSCARISTAPAACTSPLPTV